MTVYELLNETMKLGIQLKAFEGCLRIEAPKGTITPELKEKLKKHKPELLKLLTFCAGDGVSTGDFEWIAIRSRLLNETILIAPNDVMIEDTKGRTVYRASEIKHLQELEGDEIKKIHYAKKLFGGQITDFIHN